MKKISSVMIAAFVAMSALFVSCSDDDVDPATVKFDNVTNDEVTLAAGQTSYTVNATITSTENLKSVKVMKTVGSTGTQVGQAITNFPNKTSYNLKSEIDGITADCKITVTVDNGTETARTLTIKYTAGTPDPEPTPAGAISTFASKKLGSLADATTDGSSCASIDGTIHLLESAKTNSGKIDIIYFDGSTYPKSIAAPSNSAVQGLSPSSANRVSTWEIKNDTKLKKLDGVTADDFNAMDDDTLISEKVTAASTANIVSNLEVGDVIGFITAGATGKKGMIKVDSFDGNNIVISIKVQK